MELDDIRKRKEEEYNNQIEAVRQQMKMEEEIKKNVRMYLEDKAYERLMNVKIVNYKLFIVASQYILQIAQKLNGRLITDDELVRILQGLNAKPGGSGEIKIIRK
ncbi:hypothetical protein J7J90_04930 [Candidatus Micrarchaeota archaeon]|nr:hypothetical protein [Candidatus Micrarchaeota archaeon]